VNVTDVCSAPAPPEGGRVLKNRQPPPVQQLVRLARQPAVRPDGV